MLGGCCPRVSAYRPTPAAIHIRPLTGSEEVHGASQGAKEMLERQIEATDKQIDRLVYELYGLTDEEIGIVEEG